MSVPGPPLRRRPLLGLVVAAVDLLVGLLMAVRADDTTGVLFGVVWLVMAVAWFAYWRQSVRAFDRATTCGAVVDEATTDPL